MKGKELFFVYVIESPSPADLLDGRSEGRVLWEALKLSDIRSWYSLVTDPVTLGEALGPRLPEAMRINDPAWRPILHFSMHGDSDGCVLTDGSRLKWEDLRNRLQPLSGALHAKGIPLVVGMSSCFGSWAKKMAESEGQPVFTLLVGHPGEANWADLAVGFVAFYHRLFGGAHPTVAVKAMKMASGNDLFESQEGEAVQLQWRIGEMMKDPKSRQELEELLASFGLRDGA